MRFLADAGISPKTVEFLRRRGDDAIHVRELAMQRAADQLLAENALDEGLPRAYAKETYQTKCTALFEYVYESYMGDRKSSCTEAA